MAVHLYYRICHLPHYSCQFWCSSYHFCYKAYHFSHMVDRFCCKDGRFCYKDGCSYSLSCSEKHNEISKTRKPKFADFLKTEKETQPQFSVIGLPPEIAQMTIDEAAIYLKDAVDLAGNDLSEE